MLYVLNSQVKCWRTATPNVRLSVRSNETIHAEIYSWYFFLATQQHAVHWDLSVFSQISACLDDFQFFILIFDRWWTVELHFFSPHLVSRACAFIWLIRHVLSLFSTAFCSSCNNESVASRGCYHNEYVFFTLQVDDTRNVVLFLQIKSSASEFS